jgi:hypothetical protein
MIRTRRLAAPTTGTTMRRLAPICCLLSALPTTVLSQQDMQAMQRWGSAKSIHYVVEGVHEGPASMTATMGGVGDVTDRISMTLEWSLTEGKLVKPAVFRNQPSEVKNLRDREPKCVPPILKGAYEHATVLEVAAGYGTDIHVKYERLYPAVEVAQFCSGRRTIPAQKKIEMMQVVVPSPMLLAMGVPGNNDLSFSADRKSMIVKREGWTWTFTPSTAPPK